LRRNRTNTENMVKIRPPDPRVLRPALRRSLSCEPVPRSIIRGHVPAERRLTRRAGVRFVDSLGLELEDVKSFTSAEEPLVPQHVLFRLLMNAELNSKWNLEISLPILKPVFPLQPGDQANFQERLGRQKVCLERLFCFEVGITGIVQVLNLAFEKDISVRYSFTNWQSCSDTRGFWVSRRNGEEMAARTNCDTFHFALPVPPFVLHAGATLEFAICYKVLGAEFWDNNEGQNYKLTCHSYKLSVPKECEDSMIHFL
uniref:CBM21 domain-containing protein n=1 Tax=Denticeps clupeoides TaxID=299321 RepID=A0AAY4B9C6_9TELE